MSKIVLIADDLTGACDSGVQFTQKGLISVVSLDGNIPNGQKTEVIIFDTNSRALPKDEAYHAVYKIAEKINSLQYTLLYKKVDSTLRGNLGSEVDALMDRLQLDIAVVAPALPELGRTTEKGIHYLNGIPVSETEIANDPKTPVIESNIVKLLSSQSKREAVLFQKEVFKEGPRAVEAAIKGFVAEKKLLLVFDAARREDLYEVVRNLKDLPFRMAWVGSAGLAEALSPEGRPSLTVATMPEASGRRPVVVVCGSRSGVARRQADYIIEHSKTASVQLMPQALLDERDRKAEIARCQTELKEFLSKGRDVLLHVETGVGVPASRSADIPYIIADTLGEIASDAIQVHRLEGLVMTGGDTAKAIAKKLGVQGMELVGEAERGLPISRLLGMPGLLAVTKAGAFGTDQSLLRALKLLKGDEET
ncbi:four-carbon acid sugar kinase family protein [Bacillus sp. B-jedd]|uniref:four-carbon acid sugar kinase family protein n=1 Tax=Bacillus sp. B-jedd TaxID=1476857 RepID=UPI0005155FC2|nr:four-carbon acid sugar kinase family protein [Bacillus sp. B-jedd]CEG28669.1 type III effector Hrp-dependent outer protein [Bacillus sp. B-jedd]